MTGVDLIVALGDSTTAGTPGFESPIEAPPAGPSTPALRAYARDDTVRRHRTKPDRKKMTSFTVHRLGYALGAELRGLDLTADLDDDTIAAIRRACSCSRR